jgi:hypothetical protein
MAMRTHPTPGLGECDRSASAWPDTQRPELEAPIGSADRRLRQQLGRALTSRTALFEAPPLLGFLARDQLTVISISDQFESRNRWSVAQNVVEVWPHSGYGKSVGVRWEA